MFTCKSQRGFHTIMVETVPKRTSHLFRKNIYYGCLIDEMSCSRVLYLLYFQPSSRETSVYGSPIIEKYNICQYHIDQSRRSSAWYQYSHTSAVVSPTYHIYYYSKYRGDSMQTGRFIALSFNCTPAFYSPLAVIYRLRRAHNYCRI